MKKLLVLFSLFFMVQAYGDNLKSNYAEAKLGAMVPWGTGVGFRLGADYGYRIDQVVSINGSVDYFRTGFNADIKDTNNNKIATSTSTNNTTANLVKLMANLRIDIPFEIADMLKFYGQCGLGYEMMINNYTTPQDNQTFVYGDFGIELEIGANLRLGDRTKLLLVTSYNFCNVSRSAGANETLVVGTRIDVSGFGLMTGIGFEW